MMLRDLVIKHESGQIEFYAEVVIKRNEKFYTVPVRVMSNRNDLIETIDYAMMTCEDIDANWLVPKEGVEVVEHLKGKLIEAKEIEL